MCSQTSLKGAKTFFHVQFGCEKQPKVVYSVNHDIIIIASFTLDSDLELPKSDLASLVYQNKGAIICPQTS